jgi:hypothetical protein
MSVLLKNNARSTLATGINDSTTTISVAASTGSRFPSPVGGDWFPLALEDASGNIEYCKCTARSGDTLTVERAQEGSAAHAFSAGDAVELRLTAAAIIAILSSIDLGGIPSFPLAIANGGTGAITAPGARSALGIGSLGTQDANNAAITGGAIAGIADLAIADGGTGASTAANARTNLGLGTAATENSTAFAAANHNHNATYYTKAEVDAKTGGVVSGGGTSGKITLGGGFVLTWKTFTATAGSSSQSYGAGHAYSSWARAWVQPGGTSDTDVSIYINSVGTSSCTVVNAESTAYACQLFSIGV